MGVIREVIAEHRQYTEQTVRMARSDLVKTYRGAALGFAWAFVKPLVTVLVYWFAISIGLRGSKDINGFPYLLWLISGVIPWFYMNEMLTQGTESMRKYSYLITKMRYPVSTIPTFVSLSKLMVNLVLIAIVLIIFLIYGKMPTIYWLQIPLYIFFSFVFFTFWALFAAPIACISKDFFNLIKSFVFAVFWFSGVLFDVYTIKNRFFTLFIKINPVAFLVTGFRDSLVNGKWFFEKPKECLVFLLMTVVLGAMALWSFKRLRKEIPDVL